MMKQNFEIKYLELSWYDKETLTKVTESLTSLYVAYDDQRQIFETETTIYPKLDNIMRGQLAVRFLNKNFKKPHIEMSSGKKVHLHPITDPDTSFTWWIVKNKWLKDQKQWVGEATNKVGTIRFSLDNNICDIVINGSDFAHKELEQYLATFKNDLWELILDENSAVQTDAKETHIFNVNEEIISCINNLVVNAEKILKTPKVELREIQSLKPRKAVKPVSRTFWELATKANQRLLTSRDTEPSYNVAENRYVLFALERCARIIQQIVILTQNKSTRFQQNIEMLKNQYNSFSSSIKVERSLLVTEYKKLKKHEKRESEKLEESRQKLKKFIESNQVRSHSAALFFNGYMDISDYCKYINNSLFIHMKDTANTIKLKHTSKVLTIDNKHSPLLNILKPGMLIKISLYYTEHQKSNFNQITINQINNIEILHSQSYENACKILKREEETGKSLNASGWIKQLSGPELEEQEREKKAIRNRIEYYKKIQSLSALINKQVEPKYRAIQKLIKNFKALNITSSATFPNSMTFVQNPNYQGLHNCYKVLRNITNLADEDILLSLEQIDKIGLINMPLLYERWVLMQILLVLKEFRFTPQNNWKYKLIDALKTNQTDIKIILTNDNAKRYIALYYEKVLDNNMRPDFILDINWFAKDDVKNKYPQFARFVLDAKFYDKATFDRANGMMAKIEELYSEKNYSEDSKNPVFLIHPCKNLIEEPVTAQSWGKYSFLGETDISNDDNYPMHNKGAIYLNPIRNALHNDELKRLLGLFIQYKIEDSNTTSNVNDRATAVQICLRCGSSNFEDDDKPRYYTNYNSGEQIERTPRSIWSHCIECNQRQIFNHCSCTKENKTRIIKNGLYWSYHSARVTEPFNMKCPNCGGWGGW
ncbi:hypothetical protein [Bartonella sp. HY761]|uniref:hypothetical protein n=1 Tax=Bartonella sp. HY761 TaxID=2979330 RepID=UPI002201717D|nr:hypothetical protein [Bartonella sp. HY761]UXN05412.1 hypothetical protein N6A79_08825 [Bartonella sp. HY761]